jgi:hypothetical protein
MSICIYQRRALIPRLEDCKCSAALSATYPYGVQTTFLSQDRVKVQAIRLLIGKLQRTIATILASNDHQSQR